MKVFYDKETRERAKREDKGLVTIEWITPDGDRVTTQASVGPKVLNYIQGVERRLHSKMREGK